MAKNLKLLLETLSIAPPYVLVGQSYGGYIARQCLLDWPEGSIEGMVIVDSAVRRTT
jgi:pimeloyl-ACP methyl ester carboxylesterase